MPYLQAFSCFCPSVNPEALLTREHSSSSLPPPSLQVWKQIKPFPWTSTLAFFSWHWGLLAIEAFYIKMLSKQWLHCPVPAFVPGGNKTFFKDFTCFSNSEMDYFAQSKHKCRDLLLVLKGLREKEKTPAILSSFAWRSNRVCVLGEQTVGML